MTTEQFNQCVDRYSDGLYRFALKMLKDSDAAQDNVQDTFTKLWEKHSDVDFTKAKSYLFTSSYHASIDTLRKQKRQAEYSSEMDHSYTQQHSFDVKRILNEALDQLPAIQKSVLLLRDYEGYSYREIGEITGISESQVKVYIYRARVSLKERLVSIENII